MEDLYRILQVRRGADEETIAAAYARLRRRYDPELSGAFPDPTMLRKISQAYATLSDPDARRAYDESRGDSATKGHRVLREATREREGLSGPPPRPDPPRGEAAGPWGRGPSSSESAAEPAERGSRRPAEADPGLAEVAAPLTIVAPPEAAEPAQPKADIWRSAAPSADDTLGVPSEVPSKLPLRGGEGRSSESRDELPAPIPAGDADEPDDKPATPDGARQSPLAPAAGQADPWGRTVRTDETAPVRVAPWEDQPTALAPGEEALLSRVTGEASPSPPTPVSPAEQPAHLITNVWPPSEGGSRELISNAPAVEPPREAPLKAGGEPERGSSWRHVSMVAALSFLLVFAGAGLAFWGIWEAFGSADDEPSASSPDGDEEEQAAEPTATGEGEETAEEPAQPAGDVVVTSAEALPGELQEAAAARVVEGRDGQSYELSGLVATTNASGQRFYAALGSSELGEHVFFFLDGEYLGTAWGLPVRSVESLASVEGGEIRVVFRNYEDGDDLSAPSLEAVAVVYKYNGGFESDNPNPPSSIFAD